MRKTGLIAVIIVAMLAIAAEIRGNRMENSTEQKGYNIGDVATDFKLKNVDDKFVSLSDYKNAKGFIVVFTCNHCPYAKA